MSQVNRELINPNLICPVCLDVFTSSGWRDAHRIQKKHGDEAIPVPPDPIPTNLPVDPPPILDDNVIMHDPLPEGLLGVTENTSLVVDPTQPPIANNGLPTGEFVNEPATSRQSHSRINIPRDLAPFGFATSQEELATQLHAMLEDIIQKRTATITSDIPTTQGASGSTIDGASSSAGQKDNSNKFVWMRDLRAGVDQALEEFFHEMIEKEGGTVESDEEHDDHNEDEVFRDTRSDSEENDDDLFYTANHSVENLTAPAMPLDTLPNKPLDIEVDLPGARLHTCMTELERLHQVQVANGKQPAWPFVDYLEFEFVKWMVVNDISQTAREKLIKLPIIATRCNLSFSSNYLLNKMLDKLPSAGPRWKCLEKKIIGTLKDSKGRLMTEDLEIWVRDIIEVVQELIGNYAYGRELVFVPQRIFLDAEQTTRKIDEMWTADWWLRIQELLPPGATVVPIILSSDATQLTNFSGGKSAWPVYISIGNIPKRIRAKINSHSTLLLAYLPVPKLDCFRPKERGDQKCRIFHECMQLIVEPLKQAGVDGVEMDCGDGYARKCFPLLAAYIADNPEQTMIACCRRNLCHICTVKFNQRQNPPSNPAPLRHPQHTANALIAHDLEHTSSLFDEQGLKPFGKPFWAGLPHCNIFSCLTPDILHQLHKGVFKDHLMNWCLELVKKANPQGSAEDVDYRYKQIPRHSDLRHFLSGVTKLKQTTANEHKEMQKVFIGVMAGLVPPDVLPTIISVLDFIYYARLPTHTTDTLNLLQEALVNFHNQKDVFIKYGVQTDFNINKIHAMSHYFAAIWELGSPDGYNTETPERLHIEFAKRAYKATNRHQFFEQMTIYLQRREQVTKFDAYLRSVIPEYAARDIQLEKDQEEQQSAHGWSLAKRCPHPHVPLISLKVAYGINWFTYALKGFFETYSFGQGLVAEEIENVQVYPKATQIINDALVTGQVDIVHASPALGSGYDRFDTVLLHRGANIHETELKTPSYGISNHRIGQVRLIFKLPSNYGIDMPLALIQVFKVQNYRFVDKTVNMHRVDRLFYRQADGGDPCEEIIPLSYIRRTCHLIPNFGHSTRPVEGSEMELNPLTDYTTFFLNSYFDLHIFQML